MRARQFIDQLRHVSTGTPFDAKLADSEFGPFSKGVANVKQGTPFIILEFSPEGNMRTDEVIQKITELADSAPFDPIVTNARLNEAPQEIQRIYHEPPVTIIEFGGPLNTNAF